jgi:hypothetical protein
LDFSSTRITNGPNDRSGSVTSIKGRSGRTIMSPRDSSTRISGSGSSSVVQPSGVLRIGGRSTRNALIHSWSGEGWWDVIGDLEGSSGGWGNVSTDITSSPSNHNEDVASSSRRLRAGVVVGDGDLVHSGTVIRDTGGIQPAGELIRSVVDTFDLLRGNRDGRGDSIGNGVSGSGASKVATSISHSESHRDVVTASSVRSEVVGPRALRTSISGNGVTIGVDPVLKLGVSIRSSTVNGKWRSRSGDGRRSLINHSESSSGGSRVTTGIHNSEGDSRGS